MDIEDTEAKSGELIRNKDGQFIAGVGNKPIGRPKGSKNKITLLKLAAEEAWRERNSDRIDMVLDMILDAALDGDKAARKMVFDSLISKAAHQEDKTQGTKQEIKVHRMIINQGENTSETTGDSTDEG